MSVSPPPQVELMREVTLKTLFGLLVHLGPGEDAADLGLLAKPEDVGLDSELLVGPESCP